MLGEFYGRIDAVDQAISNYQTAIALKSNYDYAYFALGKIYLSQKKYALAKSNFEFTLKIAPNNTDTQNYLAFIATQSAGKK
jgi:tetratricopeptide (TPR) repeat protein